MSARAARPGRRASPWAIGLLCGGAALLLFGLTAGRGLEWQDSGFHQYRILAGMLEHPLGLALSHPLHYYLGRAALLVPFLDPAFRLNLLSSLCGAVCVGCVAALVARRTGSAAAAALCAATLATAHSFWQMSAVTETYTLAAALMSIEWLLLERYLAKRRPAWLAGVFLVNGLHVANHLLGLLTLPGYGLLLLERLARRRIALAWAAPLAALWVLGASPYLVLIAEHYREHADLAATATSALFGGGDSRGWAGAVLNTAPTLRQSLLAAATFGYCFPSAAALVALVGIVRRPRGRRRGLHVVLIIQTSVIFAFVSRYAIRDVYTYYVPVCVITAVWFGFGVRGLRRILRRRMTRRTLHRALVASACLPLVTYLVFPPLAQHFGWLSSQLRALPFRNAHTHILQPWRMLDDSAERFAAAAFAQAGPDAIILADSTPGPMLAAACLLREHPPGIRVHLALSGRCLYPPAGAAVTPGEIASRIAAGATVFAAPSAEALRWGGAGVLVDETTPLWTLRK